MTLSARRAVPGAASEAASSDRHGLLGEGTVSGPCARRYSPEAQAMQRRCTCCQETRAHEEAVTLQCPDGTAVQHTYTHIDECKCDLACVPSPAAPEQGHGSFA